MHKQRHAKEKKKKSSPCKPHTCLQKCKFGTSGNMHCYTFSTNCVSSQCGWVQIYLLHRIFNVVRLLQAEYQTIHALCHTMKPSVFLFRTEPRIYNRDHWSVNVLHKCVFMAYPCCLFDLEVGAARWAPDTLLLPLCHGRGHRGRCGCAGSGLSSCVCCWWLRCLRGPTGEPAAHHWISCPGPGGAEDLFAANAHSVTNSYS